MLSRFLPHFLYSFPKFLTPKIPFPNFKFQNRYIDPEPYPKKNIYRLPLIYNRSTLSLGTSSIFKSQFNASAINRILSRDMLSRFSRLLKPFGDIFIFLAISICLQFLSIKIFLTKSPKAFKVCQLLCDFIQSIK